MEPESCDKECASTEQVTYDKKLVVVARLRPLVPGEAMPQSKESVAVQPVRRSVCAGGNSYEFDSVFGRHTSNEELYLNVVSPLLDEALRGERSICVAWGASGSGKTHTQHGAGEEAEGLTQLAVRELLLRAKHSRRGLRILASIVEVYGDDVFDLVRCCKMDGPDASLEADGSDPSTWPALVEVNDEEQFNEVLAKAVNEEHGAQKAHKVVSLTVGCSGSPAGRLTLIDPAGMLCAGPGDGSVSAAGASAAAAAARFEVGSPLTPLMLEALSGGSPAVVLCTVGPCATPDTCAVLEFCTQVRAGLVHPIGSQMRPSCLSHSENKTKETEQQREQLSSSQAPETEISTSTSGIFADHKFNEGDLSCKSRRSTLDSIQESDDAGHLESETDSSAANTPELRDHLRQSRCEDDDSEPLLGTLDGAGNARDEEGMCTRSKVRLESSDSLPIREDKSSKESPDTSCRANVQKSEFFEEQPDLDQPVWLNSCLVGLDNEPVSPLTETLLDQPRSQRTDDMFEKADEDSSRSNRSASPAPFFVDLNVGVQSTCYDPSTNTSFTMKSYIVKEHGMQSPSGLDLEALRAIVRAKSRQLEEAELELQRRKKEAMALRADLQRSESERVELMHIAHKLTDTVEGIARSPGGLSSRRSRSGSPEPMEKPRSRCDEGFKGRGREEICNTRNEKSVTYDSVEVEMETVSNSEVIEPRKSLSNDSTGYHESSGSFLLAPQSRELSTDSLTGIPGYRENENERPEAPMYENFVMDPRRSGLTRQSGDTEVVLISESDAHTSMSKDCPTQRKEASAPAWYSFDEKYFNAGYGGPICEGSMLAEPLTIDHSMLAEVEPSFTSLPQKGSSVSRDRPSQGPNSAQPDGSSVERCNFRLPELSLISLTDQRSSASEARPSQEPNSARQDRRSVPAHLCNVAEPYFSSLTDLRSSVSEARRSQEPIFTRPDRCSAQTCNFVESSLADLADSRSSVNEARPSQESNAWKVEVEVVSTQHTHVVPDVEPSFISLPEQCSSVGEARSSQESNLARPDEHNLAGNQGSLETSALRASAEARPGPVWWGASQSIGGTFYQTAFGPGTGSSVQSPQIIQTFAPIPVASCPTWNTTNSPRVALPNMEYNELSMEYNELSTGSSVQSPQIIQAFAPIASCPTWSTTSSPRVASNSPRPRSLSPCLNVNSPRLTNSSPQMCMTTSNNLHVVASSSRGASLSLARSRSSAGKMPSVVASQAVLAGTSSLGELWGGPACRSLSLPALSAPPGNGETIGMKTTPVPESFPARFATVDFRRDAFAANVI